jgi:hypothetical protein
MNCIRCCPHKHVCSDKQAWTQSWRVDCLCDLVTYEHKSIDSVHMDNKVLYFTYNSDSNFSRPPPYALFSYTEFDACVRSIKMLVINLMIKFIVLMFCWLSISIYARNETRRQSTKTYNTYQLSHIYIVTSWWWATSKPKTRRGVVTE